MFRRISPIIIVLLLLCLSFGGAVSAQGGQLAYGTIVNGTLNPNTPLIYTFTGNQNDVVTLYLIGSLDLQPSLSVSNGSGQQVAFSTGDALTPMPNDARVTAVLPETGTYIVTLNNQSSVSGDFLISLSVADVLPALELISPTTVTIDPDTTAQQFIILANPDGPQELIIRSLRDDTTFTAQLQAGDGRVLSAIGGGLPGATMTLPASILSYTLTINAEDSTLGALVELSLSGGGNVGAPVATEEVQAPVTDPNVCTVTASGVNVRSGPGTNFDIIGSLTTGGQFIATGQNAGWYNGTFNGQSAWVASGVVNASGNCAGLPIANAPAAPVAQPTQVPSNNQATPTATATTSNDNQQPTNEPPPPTATTAPTEVPFTVNSLTCRYFLNDGATVDFNVNGSPGATFQIDVRQGSTTYSANRTLNQQGFLTGNQRFGQAGNSNYTAYIVYNGVDVASAPC